MQANESLDKINIVQKKSLSESFSQNEIETEVLWCDNCNIPLIHEVADLENKCSLCGKEGRYLIKDIRPVFPEERLLIEILLNVPLKWKNESVWANNNNYFINGRKISVSFKKYRKIDVNSIVNSINEYSAQNQSNSFEKYVELFIKANRIHLSKISEEAKKFIIREASKYKPDHRLISFSGGKDSTVTADLVIKALRDPTVMHIFCDTTLEIPYTYEYKNRYRNANPKAIFKMAKNKEQNFYKVCEDIGPPARMMRWCCTMFKTGPITRVLNYAFKDEKVLTFYGIRKCESLSRSKYNRVEDTSDAIKIQKQAVASPIFFWSDLEIWLYILGEKLDFNYAYRLGYDRVGCWCCPNNSERSHFLSRIYMPEQWTEWRNYLIRESLINKDNFSDLRRC